LSASFEKDSRGKAKTERFNNINPRLQTALELAKEKQRRIQ